MYLPLLCVLGHLPKDYFEKKYFPKFQNLAKGGTLCWELFDRCRHLVFPFIPRLQLLRFYYLMLLRTLFVKLNEQNQCRHSVYRVVFMFFMERPQFPHPATSVSGTNWLLLYCQSSPCILRNTFSRLHLFILVKRETACYETYATNACLYWQT